MAYASYRAVDPQIHTRRTKTLMEGGEFCHSRIFIVKTTPDTGEQDDP